LKKKFGMLSILPKSVSFYKNARKQQFLMKIAKKSVVFEENRSKLAVFGFVCAFSAISSFDLISTTLSCNKLPKNCGKTAVSVFFSLQKKVVFSSVTDPTLQMDDDNRCTFSCTNNNKIFIINFVKISTTSTHITT